jgi:ornithine carbamoyltransferase
MNPRPRHFIELLDYTAEEVEALLASAADLKRDRTRIRPGVMNGRTGVLIFEKPSLRTRVSFEVAICELGGHVVNLASEMVGMGKRESVGDVARNLNRWVHLIVLRTHSHERLLELARHSTIPVINALTDSFHPCQALAFGLTLRERRPKLDGGRVVFVGDGNNVCSSLMVLCAKLGYDFSVACAPGYEPQSELLATCSAIARDRGATIEVLHDPAQAMARAAVLYTDVWASMGQEMEAEQRKKAFSRFQVNDELLRRAPAEVLVSHCLPAHRGEEITDEVIDAPRCMAFDEAENRLHVQKAVIRFLLS